MQIVIADIPPKAFPVFQGYGYTGMRIDQGLEVGGFGFGGFRPQWLPGVPVPVGSRRTLLFRAPVFGVIHKGSICRGIYPDF